LPHRPFQGKQVQSPGLHSSSKSLKQRQSMRKAGTAHRAGALLRSLTLKHAHLEQNLSLATSQYFNEPSESTLVGTLGSTVSSPWASHNCQLLGKKVACSTVSAHPSRRWLLEEEHPWVSVWLKRFNGNASRLGKCRECVYIHPSVQSAPYSLGIGTLLLEGHR
jgi:hypothetical protein